MASVSATTYAIRHRWRFALVLFAALLLAVAQPLTSELFDEEGSFALAVLVAGLVGFKVTQAMKKLD